jgi:hypothetical protein
MDGGAVNCLDADEDTGAPWAAGEADIDAEADGFGNGLKALEIWADEGGVAAGRGGLGVGATGAAFKPQPKLTSGTTRTANNAT